MPTTPSINETYFETESFSYCLRCCWVAVYTHIMSFYLKLTLRCGQADFVAKVVHK
jgi:hypothetical protein